MNTFEKKIALIESFRMI